MNVDFPEENHRLFFSLQSSVFSIHLFCKIVPSEREDDIFPYRAVDVFLGGAPGARSRTLAVVYTIPSSIDPSSRALSWLPCGWYARLHAPCFGAPHLDSSATGSARIGAPLHMGGFFTQKQDRRSGPVRLSGMMLPNQSLYAFAAIAYSYSAQTAFCAAVLFAYASEPSRRSI